MRIPQWLAVVLFAIAGYAILDFVGENYFIPKGVRQRIAVEESAGVELRKNGSVVIYNGAQTIETIPPASPGATVYQRGYQPETLYNVAVFPRPQVIEESPSKEKMTEKPSASASPKETEESPCGESTPCDSDSGWGSSYQPVITHRPNRDE